MLSTTAASASEHISGAGGSTFRVRSGGALWVINSLQKVGRQRREKAEGQEMMKNEKKSFFKDLLIRPTSIGLQELSSIN